MSAIMQPPAIRAGHSHPEAFNLMWYACRSCQHRERFWNSRDGVTPFGTSCPSCGGADLLHVDWNLDRFAPDHKPHRGQRVWVDMTRERAEMYARRRIAAAAERGYDISQDHLPQMVADIYRDGTAPDMVVTGYEERRDD